MEMNAFHLERKLSLVEPPPTLNREAFPVEDLGFNKLPQFELSSHVRLFRKGNKHQETSQAQFLFSNPFPRKLQQ